jgi:hypothetical protein
MIPSGPSNFFPFFTDGGNRFPNFLRMSFTSAYPSRNFTGVDRLDLFLRLPKFSDQSVCGFNAVRPLTSSFPLSMTQSPTQTARG